MERPTRLALVTETIVHHCPYKQRTVTLATCYIDSNDVRADICYGCNVVPSLKLQFGLRTFKRRLQLNRCVHCWEPAERHRSEPPYEGKKIPCAGFESNQPDRPLYVPTNEECTEWMVVMSVSGHRMPLADYRAKRFAERDPAITRAIGETISDVDRLRLPLVGEAMTAHAMEAAEKAEKQRLGCDKRKHSEDDEPKPAAKKRAGGSTKKEKKR